jgi:hypothetical protein
MNEILNEQEEALLNATIEEIYQEHFSSPAIPENEESALLDTSTSRFSSALWYQRVKDQNILLAGLGGIGSHVAFLLSRLQPHRILIMDPDYVEESNLSGQLYGVYDIGNSKTSSAGRVMMKYSDFYDYSTIQKAFTEETSYSSDIMICGFDNMTARSVFFEKWLEHVAEGGIDNKENCLFIDGRLAAEEFQVFCIKGSDNHSMHRYSHDYLFSDEEAEETICSYKQTTFTASMIASVIVNLFVNFVSNQVDHVLDRDLPFYTYYDAKRMYFTTEP